jgi:hypothetical protein
MDRADSEAAVTAVEDVAAAHLRVELVEVRSAVPAAEIAEVAAEFDRVHSVERAQEVGSVHRIISSVRLREELIQAVERGMTRASAAIRAAAAAPPSSPRPPADVTAKEER